MPRLKVLVVGSDFLHPTTRGGQIRTLEMLRKLHQWHEIHYAALAGPGQTEGPARAGEYSTRSYAVPYAPPDKRSLRFLLQAAAGVFDPLPVAVRRWQVPAMGAELERLAKRERFDRAVCDFLFPAAHFPRLEKAVLFEHNVETVIWQRRAQYGRGPQRWYLNRQAALMERFERQACRRCAHVAAVSNEDARTMRETFGIDHVTAIPTGVDAERFAPPPEAEAARRGLVFVGSMDWAPNQDGVNWFLDEVLPLLRQKLPECPVTIAGRMPAEALRARAGLDPALQVTGTVPDIRPYLWGAAASIVPLRIGGGTRLKIYESMAAGTPVISTAVGAEGLDLPDGSIWRADDARAFADACVEALADETLRQRVAAEGIELVRQQYSWERAARVFEEILLRAPAYS